MAEKASYNNRIVGHGTETPKALSAMTHPLNWRIHPEAQKNVLNDVLKEVGWVQQCVVNQRTKRLLDGHLRVALALHEKQKEVPVVYVDVSEEEEALILASLDPISAMAESDSSQLAELLSSISTDSEHILKLHEQLADAIFPLLKDGYKLPELDDSDTDRPEEFKEYDENIETDYQCPKCGYEWSGNQR